MSHLVYFPAACIFHCVAWMLWSFDGWDWFDALSDMSSGSRVAATGSQSISLVLFEFWLLVNYVSRLYLCKKQNVM